jgi:hypothetical protein
MGDCSKFRHFGATARRSDVPQAYDTRVVLLCTKLGMWLRDAQRGMMSYRDVEAAPVIEQ